MTVSETKAAPAAATLEFYKAARSELVERVKLRDQVLLVYLAFVGAVSGTALSQNNYREVSLVLPFLGLGCAILVSQHNAVIGALIRYTTKDLHKYLFPQPCNIPDFVNSSSFRVHSPRSNFLRSVGHGIVIMVPEAAALAINYHHAIPSLFPFGPSWWFGFACAVISLVVIWTTHAGRQKIYHETPWA